MGNRVRVASERIWLNPGDKNLRAGFCEDLLLRQTDVDVSHRLTFSWHLLFESAKKDRKQTKGEKTKQALRKFPQILGVGADRLKSLPNI
jgi:hypothetical protein